MAAMMEVESHNPRGATSGKLAPWVEKYRPSKMDDVAHQDEVVQGLKKSIEIGSIPHLLFHGPPGTGKTTTILAVAKALYGPELFKSRMLELNASDERGIAVVRDKVKNFAQGAVGNQKTAGFPCPKFKIIVLDEVDTMTPDAQSALRRIIEAYSKVTRFVLICNYVTRVIEPLASRCAKFRFKPLPVESMRQRIQMIADSEGVLLAPNTLDTILKVSRGDMRKAVTFLQSSFQITANPTHPVESSTVVDLSGQVPDETMEALWSSMSGNSFDQMRAAVENIVLDGYPLSAVLLQLHDMVAMGKPQLLDINRALICEKLAQAEQQLADGANELLQLQDVAAFTMRRLTSYSSDVDALSSSALH